MVINSEKYQKTGWIATDEEPDGPGTREKQMVWRGDRGTLRKVDY
jgi:hypothetical protein